MFTRRRFLYIGGVASSIAALGVVAERLLHVKVEANVGRADPNASVIGQVAATGGGPVGQARVTLFTPDLAYFREARTDIAGQYSLNNVPSGTYRLGACAPGREYQELEITVGEPGTTHDFALGPDAHPGAWAVIGNTDPERFGGTNSGSVMSDGRIFCCHDTEDPVVFDPITGVKTFPQRSSSRQGCHMPTHLLDGRLLLVGGGDVDDNGNFNNIAVKTVRAFAPDGTWENWPDLREFRWYPGLARLADGRLLLFGGGQQPHQLRTNTCEILDPATRQSTMTGSLLRAGGFGPTMLLYTGEVLLTWEPPELYNLQTGQWRATGQFVQPNRGTNGGPPQIGDHPDHTAIFLPDGRVVAIGIRRTALRDPGSMVEMYDPATGTWSLRSSPDTLRSMPEVLMLPTGKILVAGGKKEDPARPDPVNQWGQLKRADLYDPISDTWQRMADMGDFREYHAITLLVPDGRVVTTAGTGQPGVNPPPGANTNIEAFSPPYLFRGVRPRIDSLSSTRFAHGGTFTMNVSLTSAVTSVALIGLNAISHWMDGGVPRLLSLAFSQSGTLVTAQAPAEPVVAPVGYYLLFAMVDDIPSIGRIVRIDDSAPAPTNTPMVTAALAGHVTWQGRPAQPNPLQQLPITLTLRQGSNLVTYPSQNTDANGAFTIDVSNLPTGTWSWCGKGPKFLANAGTVVLTGAPTTSVEIGLMRAGDANDDNVVSVLDFNILKRTFGKQNGDPGYDDRADFTGDSRVDVSDFNLLKANFGQSGAPPLTP